MSGTPAHAAATDQIIYDDALQSGWQNYGWATLNYSNPSPTHSGSASISVNAGPWQALYLHHDAFDTSLYQGLSFWIDGGTAGGQRLQVQALLSGTAQPAVALPPLVANAWQQVTLSLSSLGVAGKPNMDGFWIQDTTGTTQPTFYVDDISLIGVPPPSTVHLSVDASQSVGTVDRRLFGVNTAVWYQDLSSADTLDVLNQMGNSALRFPGGSLSDEYHWSTDTSLSNTWRWASSFATFAPVAEATHADSFITVNYGTGTPQEAAALVAWANGSPTSTTPIGTDSNGKNWQTAGYWASLRADAPLASDDGYNLLRVSHPAPYGFRYWEIGNENYGSWETDTHARPHDPYTYGTLARDYLSGMKAVDPTIKVGVVVTDGEDAYANYTDHPATNPRTGQVHNGWTPVLLSTLNSLGVTPDFVIYHNYAQNPGGESDAGLLQSAASWASLVAGLRQQVQDYLGATAAANVEIDCTEHNSVSSNPGKQTTSLVNGLFLADSMGYAMQTELHSLLWWDLRDGGQSTGNNNSSSLYGWRQYGSYNVVNTSTDRYPTFYARKLLTHFAAGGDQVVHASSDYNLLDAFAVRRADGTLAVLVVNKSPSTSLNGAIAVAGFAPSANAAVYSYGIPQDDAAQTGSGSADVATSSIGNAGSSFTYTFPAYSISVIALSPAAAPPTSTPVPPAATATNTPIPPTATSTSVPPTATATSTGVPPTATSTSVPPTATATSTSVPPTATATRTPIPPTATSTVTVTVSGVLSGGGAAAPASVNLTGEGTADWARWGLTNVASFDHKAGVTQQIGTYSLLNGGKVAWRSDTDPLFSWTDGTPDMVVTNSGATLILSGAGHGYRISVPAGTTTQTLRLYVGLYRAQGQLTAALSDGSAATLTESPVDNATGNSRLVYTISYRAASQGQTLTLTWTMLASHGSGNVSLQAASLS